MKKGHKARWLVWAGVAVLVSCGVANAAGPLETEADPLAQGVLKGWVTFSTNPDGSVSINFYDRSSGGAALGDPTFCEAGVATTPFVGSYPAASVKAISFTLGGN